MSDKGPRMDISKKCREEARRIVDKNIMELSHSNADSLEELIAKALQEKEDRIADLEKWNDFDSCEYEKKIKDLEQRLAEKGASLDSANARINSLEAECEQYMERSAKYEVKSDRLQALVKEIYGALKEVNDWQERLAGMQRNYLTKGMAQAEQCWAEATEGHSFDFTNIKKALEKAKAIEAQLGD